MATLWIHRHFLDEGRWRPFASSLCATLLVVGVHTGAIDWVMLRVTEAQHLSG